ncbi:phenoloxidase-activating factor 1-like [Microplitis demolitor]|uniref:phenoloxidase-activating factor 1-like n=1 Tax=Microplitis demolitor TaxID=69319 RepID=UPI0006D4F5F1|nr:phenoloxidase-activating factor 1-like [Microplitis demolitor]
MNLQEYVKFIICLFLTHFNGNLINSKRVERGFLDWISSRFRSCGGCTCGRSNRNTARFLGGETTYSHEFPWLVNVHIKSKTQVSGALINDRYIITAASQLLGATAPEIKVSLGGYDRCHIDISSVNTSVDTIIMYPEFVSETHAHDLALIRLSRPIKFEKRISPVCLPNPNSTYLGQVGTLLGWTETETDDEKFACLPRKIGLPILSVNECLKSGVDSKNYHDDSGCMGVLGTKSIVCSNDVGTSVNYRSYTGVYDLIGLLSNGNDCEASTKTAVFTRLGPHLHWILQNTKDACYCAK